MRVLVAGPLAALLGSACGPTAKAGDCADSLIAGDLVITEVFADRKAPPGSGGTDEGKEWFEVFNASDRPLELEGMTVVHARPDGSRAKSHVMTEVTIAPGQYFTLGNSVADLVPAYVDYGYSADLGDLYNSDGGLLTLSCGTSEIDRATYENVADGRSRQLTAAQPPDYTLNDDPLNWCEAKDAEFEVGNFGTPGSENDCTPVIVGQCDDNGTMRDAVTPAPGELVITEMMPRPSSVASGGAGSDGQWFEILALTAVDLNGVGLDRASDTANPTVITSGTCLHLAAGAYGVFARTAAPETNGGLTPLATFPFSINPTGGAGDVRLVVGTVVIDAVTWPTSTTGASLSLDPQLLDATANDEPGNFCAGSTIYNGPDRGSPGQVNPACPVQVQPGQCLVGTTPRPIVKPAAGQLVITEFLANPANVTGFTDAQREWFEITNTGATSFDLNGLGLARTAGTANVITSTECKPVAAGGYALFARSNDPAINAMLPPVDATFSFSLVDTTGNIEVRDGTTILDVITYPSVTSGVSRSLDPDQTTAAGNDVPANFCNGVGAYGDLSNMGTPKAANPQCP